MTEEFEFGQQPYYHISDEISVFPINGTDQTALVIQSKDADGLSKQLSAGIDGIKTYFCDDNSSAHPSIVLPASAPHSGKNNQYIAYLRPPIEGVNLDKKLKEGLSEKEKLELFQKILQAVKTAKSMELYHGWLNPKNIFITPNNNVRITGWEEYAIIRSCNALKQSIAEETQLTPNINRYISKGLRNREPVDINNEIFSLGVIFKNDLFHSELSKNNKYQKLYKKYFNDNGEDKPSLDLFIEDIDELAKDIDMMPRPTPSKNNNAFWKIFSMILLGCLIISAVWCVRSNHKDASALEPESAKPWYDSKWTLEKNKSDLKKILDKWTPPADSKEIAQKDNVVKIINGVFKPNTPPIWYGSEWTLEKNKSDLKEVLDKWTPPANSKEIAQKDTIIRIIDGADPTPSLPPAPIVDKHLELLKKTVDSSEVNSIEEACSIFFEAFQITNLSKEQKGRLYETLFVSLKNAIDLKDKTLLELAGNEFADVYKIENLSIEQKVGLQDEFFRALSRAVEERNVDLLKTTCNILLKAFPLEELTAEQQERFLDELLRSFEQEHIKYTSAARNNEVVVFVTKTIKEKFVLPEKVKSDLIANAAMKRIDNVINLDCKIPKNQKCCLEFFDAICKCFDLKEDTPLKGTPLKVFCDNYQNWRKSRIPYKLNKIDAECNYEKGGYITSIVFDNEPVLDFPGYNKNFTKKESFYAQSTNKEVDLSKGGIEARAIGFLSIPLYPDKQSDSTETLYPVIKRNEKLTSSTMHLKFPSNTISITLYFDISGSGQCVEDIYKAALKTAPNPTKTPDVTQKPAETKDATPNQSVNK